MTSITGINSINDINITGLSDITADSITTTSISTANLTATNGTITTLNSTNGTITTLNSTNANLTNSTTTGNMVYSSAPVDVPLANYNFATPIRPLNSGTNYIGSLATITGWTFTLISGTSPDVVAVGRGFWDILGPNTFMETYPDYPAVRQALSVNQPDISSYRISQSITATAGYYLVSGWFWGKYLAYVSTQTATMSFGTTTTEANIVSEQAWKKIQFITTVATTGATTFYVQIDQSASAVNSTIVMTNFKVTYLGGLALINPSSVAGTNTIIPTYGMNSTGIYNVGDIWSYGSLNVFGPLAPRLKYIKNSMIIGDCKYGQASIDLGTYNVLIGYGIGANISEYSGTGGNLNNIVAIGAGALEQAITATDQIAIGRFAGRYSGNMNGIIIGNNAGEFLGYSGGATTDNVIIGHNAMKDLAAQGTYNNLVVGNYALGLVDYTNGRQYNTIFGHYGGHNIASDYNTVVGWNSLYNNGTLGSIGNTVIGASAANTSAAINTMRYVSFLGYGSDLNSNFDCENSTAIGAFAKILESDVIELGGANQTTGAYPKVTIPNKIQLLSNTVFGASASINLYFRIGENIILTSATTATINLPVPAANSIGCKFTIYRAYNVGVPTFITIQATAGIFILADGVTSSNSYVWSGLQTVLTLVLIGTSGNAWVAGGRTLSSGSADQISTVQYSANQTNYLTFGQQSANPNTYVTLGTDTNLTYNPGTDTMTVVNVNVTRLSRLDQYLGETSPTIISATTTLASPFYEYYTFFNPAGAAIQVTLPTITAANVGLGFTFNRLGGPYTAPNFTYLLQAGSAVAAAQPAFYSASPQGSVSFTTLIGAAQSTSNVKSVVIQPAGAGQYSNAAGSASLIINSVSSGFLNIGGRVVLDGATYRITAFGTGTGLTGTYTVTPVIPLAHAAAAFTSNVSYGWVQTFVR